MDLLTIQNRAAKVKLDDVITKGVIDPLIDKIATLYGDDAVRNEWTNGDVVAVAENALEVLEIQIDSQGGSVAEGYRLYKTIMALRERGVQVVANITNKAYSMGSVVAMAADVIIMADNAYFMIHDASTTTQGDADTHRQSVATLDSISDELAMIYAQRSGWPAEDVRRVMKQELWMGAATAKHYRFVDEVYEAERKPYNPSILERLIGNISLANDNQRHQKHNMKLTDLLRSDKNEASQTLLAESEKELSRMTEEFEALKTEAADARQELVELQAKFEECAKSEEAKIADYEGRLEAKDAELAELHGKLDTLATESTVEAIATKVRNALGDEAEETEPLRAIVNELVAEEVSKSSHPPVDLSSDSATGEGTSTPHLDKFEALNGAAATAYYKKHVTEIKAELRNRF